MGAYISGRGAVMKNRKIPGEEGQGLRVRMFGGFAVEYKGENLNLTRLKGTKALQLLILLFLAGDIGMAKKDLIYNLYREEDGVDLNRNLNNVLYRLKKYLVSLGITEEVIVLEHGFLRMRTALPVRLDVREFETGVKEAERLAGDERAQVLEAALLLYRGELLPELPAEL